MFTRPANLCTKPVECLPGCPGVLCVNWEVSVSTDVTVHTGVQGSSRSFHNSMRAAFAVALMGSMQLMILFRDFRSGTTPRCPLSGCLSSVYSLPCPFRTSCHRSPDVWWRDSGEYGQTVGVCWFQTACDHLTGFIQCRVQFRCMGGALPHRASILCS